MTVTTTVIDKPWPRFVSGRRRPPHIHPAAWSAWKRGESRPATPMLISLSIFWRVSEADILRAAGYEFESLHDAWIGRKISRVRKYNKIVAAKQRSLYHADQSYREKVLAYAKERSRKKHAANPGQLTLHKRRLNSLTSEQRREHMAARRKKIRQAAVARGAKWASGKWKPKPKSYAWIKRQISFMNKALDRIQEKLDRKSSHPWHQAGCLTRAQWKLKDPNAWHEYMLAHWKAASNKKDSAKLFAKGSWSRSDWLKILYQFDCKCAYCGVERNVVRRNGFDLEADHVIALQAWKLDKRLYPACTNSIANIVPACKACNSSKSNGDLIEWAAATRRTPHPIAIEKYHKQMAKCTAGPTQTDLRELLYG